MRLILRQQKNVHLKKKTKVIKITPAIFMFDLKISDKSPTKNLTLKVNFFQFCIACVIQKDFRGLDTHKFRFSIDNSFLVVAKICWLKHKISGSVVVYTELCGRVSELSNFIKVWIGMAKQIHILIVLVSEHIKQKRCISQRIDMHW